MLGFKSQVSAAATPDGIELVQMMRNRQARFVFNPNRSLAEQLEILAAAL
jgi:putative transposase